MASMLSSLGGSGGAGLGSMMGGMMGGGGGGSKGKGEGEMATQNIMGMDIPDFMGNMQKTMGKNDPNQFSNLGGGVSMPDTKTSLGQEMSKSLTPPTGGENDSDLKTALAGTKDQINQLGSSVDSDFDAELNKRYPKNYGLKLQ